MAAVEEGATILCLTMPKNVSSCYMPRQGQAAKWSSSIQARNGDEALKPAKYTQQRCVTKPAKE